MQTFADEFVSLHEFVPILSPTILQEPKASGQDCGEPHDPTGVGLNYDVSARRREPESHQPPSELENEGVVFVESGLEQFALELDQCECLCLAQTMVRRLVARRGELDCERSTIPFFTAQVAPEEEARDEKGSEGGE
jgi:hypothetical protein